MAQFKQPPVYSRPTYAIDFIPCNTIQEGVYLGSPAFDASVRLNVTLGAEMWAARRRLKIVDSLVAKNVMPTASRVEGYTPTPEENKAWAAERDQFIKDHFGALIETAQNSPNFTPLHTLDTL
jgi:hypothetical protein